MRIAIIGLRMEVIWTPGPVEGAEVVAVSDPLRRKRAREPASGLLGPGRHARDHLSSTKPIATPPADNAEIAIACLDAVCTSSEKPLALTTWTLSS